MGKNDPQVVNLTIEQRYVIAKMQPTTGNFIAMTMTKNLIAMLEMTPEEVEAWGYKSAGSGRWVPVEITDDAPFQQRADVTFTRKQFGLIASQLEALDAAGKLELIQVPLYELFVDGVSNSEADDAPQPLRAEA